jgi:hypothetical protein
MRFIDMENKALTERDFQVAQQALVYNWPELQTESSEYTVRMEVLAKIHQHFGHDKFELYYNLRPPLDKKEEWYRELMQGGITEEELKDRLRSDANRPIDIEMISTFHAAYEDNVRDYSEVLQTIISIAREQDCSTVCAKTEREVDEHIEAFGGKFPLWKENIETVFLFLEEMRIELGLGLAKIGEFEGTSFHWLVQLVLTETVRAWESCKEIAARSQTETRYLYSTTASALFYQMWLARLPKPQSLLERLREEFVRAKLILKQRQVTETAEDTRVLSVLFLSADPTDASRLRLGEELREIQEKLQLAKNRGRFVLHQRMSLRPADMTQAMLDTEPHILHFSGHGRANGALCFENNLGQAHSIEPDALAGFFDLFANRVHCVVLNACYSEVQAHAIAKHIDYVIGMNQAIGDHAAIAFSVGFYQAVGAGYGIEEAYKAGRVQIMLQGISEQMTPVLIKKQQ